MIILTLYRYYKFHFYIKISYFYYLLKMEEYWTYKKIKTKIDNYHRNHIRYNQEKNLNHSYKFDIDSLMSDFYGNQTTTEIVTKIKSELVNPDIPIKDNAKELLTEYLIQLFNICSRDSAMIRSFNYLMYVMFICSYCGSNDHLGGYQMCGGCKRSYCHECWYDGFTGEQTRNCIYCSKKRQIIACDNCGESMDSVYIRMKCWHCQRRLCPECFMNEQHGAGICR